MARLAHESDLEYRERLHHPDYVAELRTLRARAEATPGVMEICRAWNREEQFGWPGQGSADWVLSDIIRAETAARIMKEVCDGSR